MNQLCDAPNIAQFGNSQTATRRAAHQAQIIAYIDEYKLLMIATLAGRRSSAPLETHADKLPKCPHLPRVLGDRFQRRLSCSPDLNVPEHAFRPWYAAQLVPAPARRASLQQLELSGAAATGGILEDDNQRDDDKDPDRVADMARQYEVWARRCGVIDREKIVALMASQGVTRAFWEKPQV